MISNIKRRFCQFLCISKGYTFNSCLLVIDFGKLIALHFISVRGNRGDNRDNQEASGYNRSTQQNPSLEDFSEWRNESLVCMKRCPIKNTPSSFLTILETLTTL